MKVFSQMGLRFSWSVTAENALQRRRHQISSSTNKHKYQVKVHIWAGISKEEGTQIVLFSDIMNATKYGDILAAVPVLKVRQNSCQGKESQTELE